MTLRIALTALVVFLLIAALAAFLMLMTRLLGRVASALQAVGATIDAAETQTANVDPAARRMRHELDHATREMGHELPRGRRHGHDRS